MNYHYLLVFVVENNGDNCHLITIETAQQYDNCLSTDSFEGTVENNDRSPQPANTTHIQSKLKSLVNDCLESLILLNETAVDLSETVSVNTQTNEINMNYLLEILHHICSEEHLFKLLEDFELKLLESFLTFPHKYRAFCLRLFKRMEKWYRFQKLCDTIKIGLNEPELNEMFVELSQKGFILTDISSETLKALLDLLLVPEFTSIYKSFKLKKVSGKEALIKNLLAHSERQKCIFSKTSLADVIKKQVVLKLGKCVKINESFKRLLWKVHLMYSFATPEYHQISDLYRVLHDVNAERVVFPQYRCKIVDVFGNVDNFKR